MFLKLHPSVEPMPSLTSMTDEEMTNFDKLYPQHRFSHAPVTFASEHEIGDDDSDLRCLFNVGWTGREFGSSAPMVDFERAVARLG